MAADPSHLVSKLPGQPQVGFKQYAGQVALGSDSALFYWFYEADHADPSSLPLVLWLNGGPGCSSVGAGALGELGPFRPNDEGNGLVLNPNSWNKAANLIFLESPAGVGFSYPESDAVYTDDQTAEGNLAFLLQWFRKFPEYSKNDFYVLGESYSGHYIPTLAAKIVAHTKAGGSINFKGFAIGNAWTAAHYDLPGNLEFLYSHSLISDEVYNLALKNCYSAGGSGPSCDEAQASINEMTANVDPYNVYKPVCGPSLRANRTLRESLQHVYLTCSDSVSTYLNTPSVQAALHVQNRPVSWGLCSNLDYSGSDMSASMVPVYEQLLNTDLRIWLYSGDFDSVVSTLSTRSWLRTLNMSVETAWYPWSFQGQVGGWTQSYSEGLSFVTVRGAGHMVPADQPGPALAMFTAFLQGEQLPSFS